MGASAVAKWELLHRETGKCEKKGGTRVAGGGADRLGPGGFPVVGDSQEA